MMNLIANYIKKCLEKHQYNINKPTPYLFFPFRTPISRSAVKLDPVALGVLDSQLVLNGPQGKLQF